ncbi:AraC family transcriptional regulator [Polaribacter tangerinus]|uniref:AraC family transcriptional regulator n=1 Tax=Polaribacter tangerinus TaxID=1920034 RepID=UPI000B4AA709|nr:helix-turn-helix domain-containing protein [Polaribacter tangerinus]
MKAKGVKTYQKVDANKEHASFGISKMEDVYEQRKGKIDAPHRHNYFTVLIIEKASGKHKIDFNTYKLDNKQVYFVAPGQVHQVIEEDVSYGFVMTFSNQFLIENSIPLSFIDSLNLFNNYGQSPPLLPNENQFGDILQFSEQILKLFHSNSPMKLLSIGAFLKLLLIECNTICSINPVDLASDVSSDMLVRNFKSEVDIHYKHEHSTSFYAEKLFITPDHLNRTIKAKIGKTAKDYIQTRIIIEAKRLLYFTDLSAKEIGFNLGFNEPSNFSTFFKKHTNVSPHNFKKSQLKS